MTGTLALWYEPNGEVEQLATAQAAESGEDQKCLSDVIAKAPTVELHVNIWRDLKHDADFFDIGFKLFSAERIGRFFLFIPRVFDLDQVDDLSPLLEHRSSLNAVFNDVLDIENRRENSFDTKLRGAPFARIQNVNIQKDLTLQRVDMDGKQVGTTIVFGREICGRMHEDYKSHYIRLRFTLNESSRRIFSSEVHPTDWWLLPSFSPVELVEFRLNERRSIPPEIVDWFDGGAFRVSKIQYFLIRDLRHELVVQHRDFRKVRILEASLWRNYLKGKPPQRDEDLAIIRRNSLIIYHWSEKASCDTESIDDFHAFAKFSGPRSNLMVYLVFIVLLGALGGAVQDVIAEQVRKFVPEQFNALLGIITFGLLILGAVAFRALAGLARSAPVIRKKFSAASRSASGRTSDF